MRKVIFTFISVLCVILLCVGLTGCELLDKFFPSEQPDPTPTETLYLINGGFESADLSGWTVEYGDAFDDDCVSSQKTFMYDFDANNNILSINQTGNWYLTGKGYHGNYSGARTGALRSAVQQALRKNKYVKKFRLGVYGEGEDGVTIAEFS